MKSPGLGLCWARGNIEWVPDWDRSRSKGETPPPLPGGSGQSCRHQGGPQAQPHWQLHQHPRSFHCIPQDSSWPSFGSSRFKGEIIFPGTPQIPRHQLTAPAGRMPQPIASPKATKCPTEESATAPTCSQPSGNRLDKSCIPNGGGQGGGGGSLKAGRDFQVPLN